MFTGTDTGCTMPNDCTVQLSTFTAAGSGGTWTEFSTVDSDSDVNSSEVEVDTNTGDVKLKQGSYSYEKKHRLRTTCNSVEGAIITVAAKTCTLAAASAIS